ncbi:Bgt-51496 [Blumeria graminis f. sp. tritici]|uniref:Bgt-51496 n=1 Tax=Blumeria graminis f. sp. tritici TaxID=62690 RepID=A0A9X9LBL9_BLUGR|nr:Bgt-51496 [Blumeria graminis f. sp. tritici]
MNLLKMQGKKRLDNLPDTREKYSIHSRCVDFSMDSTCIKQTLNCGCLIARAHVARAS